MTRFVCARFAAAGLLLAVAFLGASVARADVFLYNGEIFFCSTTCNSFGALGGMDGGSDNTVNSVVVGSLDIPVQPDGTFSFATTDNVPFDFTITTSAIPFEAPVINGPGVTDCPPPDAPGQLCNAGTVNPLPLSNEVATVEGFGVVGTDGFFVSGEIKFVFTVPPFSNNGAEVTFDLSDSTGEGFVFGGVSLFTQIAGAGDTPGFAPAPPDLSVGMPVPDPFPDTLVGDTSTATVTVSNAGQGAAVITLGTSTLMAPFAIDSENCTTDPLAPSTSCTINVSFSPTADGAAMGSFTVDSATNDPNSIAVELVGNAIVPEIGVAPDPLVFDDVLIGQSASLDVTVSNTGTAALNIPADGVSALIDPFAITADGCSGTAVAPGGTCVITVTFTPAMSGPSMGSFDIMSDDPNEATVTVEVSGAGAAPQISVSPQTLTFPSQLTGQVQTRTVTVTNDGSADLVIGMIDSGAFVAPFSLAGDACSGATLMPDASCELMIEFAPTMEGDFSNDYTIPSNDEDEADFAASVEGTATQAPEPFITVMPADLSLGDVIVSAMSMGVVTVTNDGSADLEITGVTVGGTNAAEFTQTNQCVTLAPEAQCEIMVTFAPADVGTRTAQLTIASNGANETMSMVTLTGEGVLGPQLTVPDMPVMFGSAEAPIELDQTTMATLMVSSSGSLPVTVSDIALSGDGAAEFAVSEETCTGDALAPMTVCEIDITFAPVTAGDKTATLTVTSDDVDMPMQTVALTGFVLVGSRPEFSVPELQIGESTDPVTVGQSGNSNFDITNTGTDPLLVVSVALGGADADQFTLTEDCTAAQVDRNGSCNIVVTFTPTSAGEKSAELTIVTDSAVTRQIVRGTMQLTTVIPIVAVAAEPPPPPPPPPASQTNTPPEFATSDASSAGACFIATAAYGSYLDPNVEVLRDFRDRVLMRNAAGREFVRFYYANSPRIADAIARNDGARVATRVVLTPLVYGLAYPVPALMVLASFWYLLRRRRAVRAAAH